MATPPTKPAPVNERDAIAAFADALRRRGIVPPARIVPDGKLHRCDAEGGAAGKGDAAYVLHLDGAAAGGFQNHRDGLGWENWSLKAEADFTPEERRAFRVMIDRQRRERDADQARRRDKAAEKAAALWSAASPAPADHPYLIRKGVSAHGLRLHKETLVVPIRDAAGVLHSLQFIDSNGGKRFLSHGAVQGHFHLIGTPDDGPLLIAEGYATAATLFQATGRPVAVAFDAGNLQAVATACRAAHPTVPLIVAADDDHRTAGNPGRTKAEAAAASVGGKLVMPEFGTQRGGKDTDFNDLAGCEGMDAVRRCVGHAVALRSEPVPHVIPERRAQVANAVRVAPVADLAAERNRRRRPALEDAPVLTPIDPICWEGLEVPEREWIVPDWIPKGTVTALYGDGGVGKTLAAQQLLTACATGKPWLGKPVQPCRTMAFLCEDGADELHRRQADICRHYDIELGDLENMRLFSRVADDNLLMTFDPEGIGQPTPLFAELVAQAKAFGAQVLVIDTAADVFGGNENIRNQVRQFIAALTRVAIEIDGAVLLCAHPSIDGMNRGHGFAGSTAWNNSVRSRLYLTRPAEDEAGAVDPEERLLTRMKANYAAAGEAVRLRWTGGVLVSPEPESGMFAAITRNRAEAAFLECLDQLAQQGRTVSDSPNAAQAYAPKTMRKMGPARGIAERDLALAMERLFERHVIEVVKEGRHQTRKVVRSPLRGSG